LTQEAYPQVLKVAAWIDRTNKDLKIVGHCSSLPLDADADAPDPIQLGYLRALTVARLLAGENGDLAAMAKRSEQGDLRLLAGKMKNIDFSRINLSTMGDFAPNAARRALWENPEIDDRVEVVPLPRLR
jgi:hypothetical protein